MPDDDVSVSIEEICALSVEHWRLRKLVDELKDSKLGHGIRLSIGRSGEVLARLGIEIIDLAGRGHDPGMTPEVIEVRADNSLSPGQVVVDETVSPIVMWRGRVVASGQIVVRRPELASEGGEVPSE